MNNSRMVNQNNLAKFYQMFSHLLLNRTPYNRYHVGFYGLFIR